MKVLFVANPAHGQINPLLAISHELLNRGHTVHVCSADRLKPRIERLAAATDAGDRLVFHGVGDGLSVEDLTPYAHAHPEVFHTRARHRPGDLASYVNLVCEITSPGDDEYKRTVFTVRDIVLETQADMVVVDNFSPFAMDGVRLSKARFVLTSPGAACSVARSPSPFKYPIPLSGASGSVSSRGGLPMLWRNFSFIFWFVGWCFRHPFPKARREFRYNVLGLPPVDLVCDSFMTPVPGMVKEMVAALAFNVSGLDLYGPECYNDQVFWVGPCFAPENPKAVAAAAAEPDEIKDWLDAAQQDGGEVIYVNFGSIFYFTAEEYDNLISAIKDVQQARPNIRALIKVPKLDSTVQPIAPASELPPFIRRETWLPSINAVLEHPVVKIAVHHGGGNSFNEAVYYGIPQLVISQWGETHDIASYARAHGLGLTSDKAPKLDREEIAENLEILLRDNAIYRTACLRWKIRCQQAGGSKVSADIIESYGLDKGAADVLVQRA